MKIKIITILICLTVLVLILSFDNHLELRKNVIVYEQLEWDDFDGFPKPFSNFDAEIHSQIEVSYDSLIDRYTAFPVMNRNKSWVNSSAKDSEELLRHEQYHFNIVKYFADKLDYIIVNEKHKYRSSIEFELGHITGEMNDMQVQYDRETEHSIIESVQRKWEYKIDSLLSKYEKDKGLVNDLYSGAQAFFIDSKFSTSYDSINEHLKRVYYSDAYDMIRMVTSVNYNYFSDEAEANIANSYKNDDSFVLEYIEHKEINGLNEIHLRVKDTIENSYRLQRRVFHNGYTYIITTVFSEERDGIEGFEAIANSFIESFQINNNDQYWIDLFKMNSNNSKYVSSTNFNGKKEVISRDNCYEYGAISYKGFIGEPILIEDGSSIVPYFLPQSLGNEISKFVLSYGRTHYIFKADSTETIFHFPKGSFKNELTLGYTMKKDSLDDCTPIYFGVLE